MTKYVLLGLAAVVLLTTGIGCKTQSTVRQKYETIYIDQPASDVERVLGEPERKFSNEWWWGNEKGEPFYKIVVTFKDGRVEDKAWYDNRYMGVHPTRKPKP